MGVVTQSAGCIIFANGIGGERSRTVLLALCEWNAFSPAETREATLAITQA